MDLVKLLSDFIGDDALFFINLEDVRDELRKEQGVKIWKGLSLPSCLVQGLHPACHGSARSEMPFVMFLFFY